MKRSSERSRSGWILVVGLALAALGLVTESQTDVGDPRTQAVPFLPGYATSDSNGSMIAVTGIDITGGSILYLVDTEARQIAVYQATGGTASTMGIKFVGARNIDLDLQVDGYNDKSEYTFKELEDQFSRAGGGSDGSDDE